MSTSYFTSVWADIPVTRTKTLIRALRKAAGTTNFDAWLPWTHACPWMKRSQRPKTGVQVFIRNEVGLSAGPGAQKPFEVARRFQWAVRSAFPDVEPQIETVDLETGAQWISGRIEEGLTDVGDMAVRDRREKHLRRQHRTTRGRALMAMAIPIDQAIRLLTKAKARIGGDKMLVFTTDGATFNLHEEERYVETRLTATQTGTP